MSEILKVISNVEKVKEAGVDFAEVGNALGDAIRKHPEKALYIGGTLVGLYILKNKKIKLKYKDIEFETE